MANVPDTYVDLLQGVHFAHFVTLGRDGAPQVSPVWVDYDGTHVLINSAEDRAKVRNLERDARVALSVHDQQNPYRYVQVRGEVVERAHDGAEEHIDALAKRYMGVDSYPLRQEGDVRVILKIRPDRVQVYS